MQSTTSNSSESNALPRASTPGVSIFFTLILLSLFVFAVFERFHGITTVGITGADTFSYWKKALLWSEGEYLITKWYRPVAVLTYAAAMRLLGPHDYTIKVVNASADVLTMLLLFGVALWLLRNKWLALFSTALYAFLPRIIYQSRIELLHILSGTYVLLTYCFFVLFLQMKEKSLLFRSMLLSIAALLAGMGANIHPDLAFLGPAYVLCLAMAAWQERETLRSAVLNWFRNAALFTGVFLIPHALGVLAFGLEKTVYVMVGIGNEMTHAHNSDSQFEFFAFLQKTMIKFLSENSSYVVAYAFWGVFACVGLRLLLKKKEPLAAYLPLLLIVCHIIIFCALTNKRVLSRLFIPFMPFVALMIVFWYQRALEIVFKRRFASLLVAIFACYLLFTARTIRPYSGAVFISKTHEVSRFRSVYDVIGDSVDEENKLIIFPILVYRPGHGFNFDTYFREHAIYGMYVREPIEPFLLREKVRYMYVGKTELDYRVVGGTHFLRSFRGGLSPEEYSLEKEYEYLNGIVKNRNAKRIGSWEHGDLYDLGSG